MLSIAIYFLIGLLVFLWLCYLDWNNGYGITKGHIFIGLPFTLILWPVLLYLVLHDKIAELDFNEVIVKGRSRK